MLAELLREHLSGRGVRGVTCARDAVGGLVDELWVPAETAVVGRRAAECRLGRGHTGQGASYGRESASGSAGTQERARGKRRTGEVGLPGVEVGRVGGGKDRGEDSDGEGEAHVGWLGRVQKGAALEGRSKRLQGAAESETTGRGRPSVSR